MFRLGRILPGGAKGPGMFFIVPCIDSYTKVDLRTVTFDVPPQEVYSNNKIDLFLVLKLILIEILILDFNERFSNSSRRCSCLLSHI